MKEYRKDMNKRLLFALTMQKNKNINKNMGESNQGSPV
jgi:hypothetical protein